MGRPGHARRVVPMGSAPARALPPSPTRRPIAELACLARATVSASGLTGLTEVWVGVGALGEVLTSARVHPNPLVARSPQPWTTHDSATSWSRAILTVASSVATSARRMSE